MRVLESMTLDPAHTIGHRGLNETMPDAPILAKQPDPSPYVGVYRRPPLTTTNTLRAEGGQLTLDGNTIGFYAPDRDRDVGELARQSRRVHPQGRWDRRLGACRGPDRAQGLRQQR